MFLRLQVGSAVLAAAPLLFAADSAAAHEVPGSVTVQVLVKQQDDRLQVLLRTPLEAMQEMQFPVGYRGILDLEALRAGSLLVEAADRWITPNLDLYAGRDQLPTTTVQAVRLSIPSDRSFTDFDRALAHIRGPPLPATTQLVWRQALLDVHLETPLGAHGVKERPRFSIDPRFGRLGLQVLTVIRYESSDGDARALQLAAEPGRVRLDPNWAQASIHFIAMGFEHILSGLDHLLFLVCLVAPLRRLRQLVLVVTSFTVAHSITLIASAAGLAPRALWFPTLVEVLIALSIVYMAFENILGVGQERRWTAAFGFGLVHGFGFSFALSESLQFAGSHLVTSLLAFNVGVELGQLLVLLLLIPLLDFVFRRLPNERLGTILISALIVHTAWHWTGDRGSDLLQYRPLAPLLDTVPQGVLPWILVIAAAAVPTSQWLRRRRSRPGEGQQQQPNGASS
ncbi:MAG: HupE/UreJ family protein [Holophagales bacterium]|nr:HupE/UreJ family protein [Holophagales bacterium]MXX61319.1 HupE/UreJ family protein [Holophagales bacterium]MYC09978.1 HupE/UreJ family protein [Holophagales bacterium]MYD24141.1 HupE/UreJ family protein [Holophagales bacterium]MYI34701.1 HupE/UreJ family protein [Holophagales bacterium]